MNCVGVVDIFARIEVFFVAGMFKIGIEDCNVLIEVYLVFIDARDFTIELF